MGGNSSNPNNNKQVSEALAKEVDLYKTGKMSGYSVRFQLFLYSASQLIAFHRFYQEVPIQQIFSYFANVQFFTYDEVNTIIQELAETAGNSSETDNLVRNFLSIINCPYQKTKKSNTIYLSPCCCKELYDNITKKKKYKTSWGVYYPGTLFDFNSDQLKQMRDFQEKHPVEPQFHHSNDTCHVIFSNSLSSIYSMHIADFQYTFDKSNPPSKPLNWEKNIHVAATKGNVKSIQYNIYLLPLLRDLQDEVGNTPSHLASKNGEDSTIQALKKLNANFNIFNNNGNLPIHIAKTTSVFERLIEAGCDMYIPNKNGQTIIEIQSNPFNKEVVEGILGKGFNILYPNFKGIYWMQYVIHNDYYCSKKKTFLEFQKFVRKILSKSPYEFYTTNQNLQQILSEDVKDCESRDAEFLRSAVVNLDVDKILTYLAIGARPDTKVDSGVTNLMILCERGNLELAQVFANNFCDPNETNTNGENSFWLAAINRHYDLATILHNVYYANPDILSKSGQTLLHVAYSQGNQELLYYLLNNGASPNIPNSDRETVQYIAFMKKDDQIAEMIQSYYKGDINSKGKEGNSLGHLAILQHDINRLEYYIHRGLSIGIKNDLGYSLFMSAIVDVDDDLDLCKFLLDRGSNINTQDAKGGTPFYNVCKSRKFNREKFDFLLQNKCNINIQTIERDFPISQLISKNKKEEALLLLDMKANIMDPESPTEPICIAIKNRDQYWFDLLIEHGSNGMNKKYPLIENYIRTDFFNFNTLKRLMPLNSTVGAPIQISIKRCMFDVAHFLWENADQKSRILISKSVDDEHRIPISAAILANDDYLVNQLVRKEYDLTTSDNIKRTPFMYACISNNPKWMTNIEQYISLDDLNSVDSQQNSALTFVANNNRVDIADHLFMKGVDVYGINHDVYGIIQRYVWILDQYHQIERRARENQEKAQKLADNAESKVRDCQRRIDELGRNLELIKSKQDFEKQNNGNTQQFEAELRNIDDSLRKERVDLDRFKGDKKRADDLFHLTLKNHIEIFGASRETMLYRLDNLDHLSRMPPYNPPHHL